MRAMVCEPICAKGTSRSAARSANIARSPPLSCTLAIPLPPRTRRGQENSSIVSAISSSVRISCTP